jgi:hypothetical protein
MTQEQLQQEIERLHRIVEQQGFDNIKLLEENRNLKLQLQLLHLSRDRVYDV